MSGTTIRAAGGTEVSVGLTHSEKSVALSITGDGMRWACATLRPEQVDDLIHALATARVELSKARPTS